MYSYYKVEGTHRVQTHAIYYCCQSSVKNAHIDPVTLIFDLSTAKPHHFYDIPRSFTTKFEHFGHSFLSYAVDKQTNGQTQSNIPPILTDSVGVCNEGKFFNTTNMAVNNNN